MHMINTSFSCNFSVSDDPLLKRLPDHIQSVITGLIIEVIYESFITPADEDYLTARLLGKYGLPRGFAWSAGQAIEKYFKAFLMLQGKSSIFSGHPIIKLYEAAIEIDPTISEIPLAAHPLKNIRESTHDRLKNLCTDNFIRSINEIGSPHNRYNLSGIEFDAAYVYALDGFAFQLRSKMRIPDFEWAFRNYSEDSIRIFKDGSPFFQNEKHRIASITPEFKLDRSMTVPILQFILDQKDKFPYNHVLYWLKTRMHIPKGKG